MGFIFKLVDYAAAILMGIGTLFLVVAVVDCRWNMILSMVVGMLLGTIVLALVLILFTGVSTPFEIITVGMPVTMLVGMGIGMNAAAGWSNIVSMISVVIIYSIAVQFGVHRYNLKLKGDVPLGNGE